jgi:phosphomannomutase
VVVNASTSRMVDDVATMLGFPVFRTPVGEINVVEGMYEHGAELGGEGNGGLIYGPLHFGRDGLCAAAVVIDLLARERAPLSDIVRKIPRYEIVKEKITIDPAKRDAYLSRIAESAGSRGAELDTCDGVKLVWADRWLHVRRSNTEPIVRIIAEAPSRAEAVELCREAREAVPD